MINPSDVNIENHTASFTCSAHGGSVTDLNLNTSTSYTGKLSSDSIIVSGAELTPSCDCSSSFPLVGGNADAQAIAAAKTE